MKNKLTALYNIEAEKALLGALICNSKSYAQIEDFFKAAYFSSQVFSEVYQLIATRIEENKQVDFILLKEYFERYNSYDDTGDKLLGELAGWLVTTTNVRDYAERIYDLYLRRQLVKISNSLIADCYAFEDHYNAMSYIENATTLLYQLSTQETASPILSLNETFNSLIPKLERAYHQPHALHGFSTGFTGVDSFIGGLQPSDLLILAGRPSMGKTALVLDIACHVASQKRGVLFFSLEMSAEQLALRIISRESQISGQKIKCGQVSEKDFISFMDIWKRNQNFPLYIDESSIMTTSMMRTRARYLKKRHDISLIVIDYLQLISSELMRENRVHEVAKITKDLKALAKELHVPVIVLSQLSRNVENRENKRPFLSDLRDSGSIEQDADVVMFIYREDYYSRASEADEQEKVIDDRPHFIGFEALQGKPSNKAEIIIAKNRNGPTGTAFVTFNKNLTSFSDTN